jgi:3-hydroxyacyl-[acyl-carrier-protein] dehydratase
MSEYRLNIEQIRQYLPHRAPFLLVDRILEIHPMGDLGDLSKDDKAGVKVVGIKNFTYNEPFFQGHFPDYAIAPGVLLVEMMAQVASFSIYPYLRDTLARGDCTFQVFLAGVDNTRFRKPVTPGDTVRIETTVTKKRGKLWMFECQSLVDGQKVAEAELMANLVLLDKKGNPL